MTVSGLERPVGVRVCVLDRRNPLGGRAVAGPVLEREPYLLYPRDGEC